MPQAAMMSSPREARMVAVMPCEFRRSRNAVITGSVAVFSSESGMAWKRIRFTRHCMLRSSRARASAWRMSSFTPRNMVYSTDRRR